MATAATTNDQAWAVLGRIRAIAAHTGNPEINAIAESLHASLMGPPVVRNAYSPDERMHVAHDSSVAMIIHRPITQDKYRRFRERTDGIAHALDAKPEAAAPNTLSRSKTIHLDAYAQYRR